MRIKDIMTPSPECIAPEESVQEAARKMRNLDVGPLPVCENDRLAGMITDRDIVVRAVAEGRNPQTTKVREVMTPEVLYCYDDQDFEEAAGKMRVHQVRRLLVLNRDARLVGIVSLGELATETHDPRKSGEVLQDVSEPVAVHG